jgi:hypothetical protein
MTVCTMPDCRRTAVTRITCPPYPTQQYCMDHFREWQAAVDREICEHMERDL